VAREILEKRSQRAARGAYALAPPVGRPIKVAISFGQDRIIAPSCSAWPCLGETIAVTMVIGNNPQVSTSLFAPQYSHGGRIGHEFTEAGR